MRRTITAILVFILIFFLLIPVSSVGAWDQPTHQWINFEAVKVFLREYSFSDMEKYQLGRVDERGSTEQYRGIAVKSRSLLIEPWRPMSWMGFDKYEIGEATMSLAQWVAHGGDWADEPHLYASVRHFYDPLAMWGHHYLTDHFQFHGWYDAPGVDARTWALDHHDNPFSFIDALVYYKAAMEVPEGDLPAGPVIKADHFKLNINLQPLDAADKRGIYLAMAYRALGETLHLMGDMTQPAHVRNDSHPIDEPIEKALKSRDVIDAAANPFIDTRIARYLASAGGELVSPAEIFHQVALFSNQYFYSADTIYDAGSFGKGHVTPQNIGLEDYLLGIKKPYPSPQFKDLRGFITTVSGWVRDRDHVTYYGEFYDDKLSTYLSIPMAQERLSFHWFAPAMGVLEKMALGPYHIPPSYAKEHARVLMPIAIYACADLMHHFYPTLELKAEYLDLGVQEETVAGRADYKRQVIEIDTSMLHRRDEDMAWTEYNLGIEYSGPAKLVFAKGNDVLKIRELHFLHGRLDKIENHTGEMVQEPLRIFIAERGVPLTAEEAFYEAERGYAIYLEIQAGSRTFKSPAYDFEKEVTVSIQPPRIVTYELLDGATEAEHVFEAWASEEGSYVFEWDFGDGKTLRDTPKPGESYRVKHTYRGLQDGDKFYPSVKLYSMDGELLAEDAITIRIQEAGDETSNIDDQPFECDRRWNLSIEYSQLERLETEDHHGFYHVWYENRLDQKHGLYLIYIDRSQSKTAEKRCYYKNQPHGMWEEWHPNGIKIGEIHYYQIWVDHPDPALGQIIDQDAQHLRIEWYDNGQKWIEAMMRGGNMISWTEWNRDGSIKSTR